MNITENFKEYDRVMMKVERKIRLTNYSVRVRRENLHRGNGKV